MRTRLPGNNALFAQVILLSFFLPFNAFLWYIAISADNNSLPLLFSGSVTLVSLLIIWLTLKTADVSIDCDAILISQLFGTKRASPQQLQAIGTFLPFGYFLDFKDISRVYVVFGAPEMIRRLNSKSGDVVEEIRSTIKSAIQDNGAKNP